MVCNVATLPSENDVQQHETQAPLLQEPGYEAIILGMASEQVGMTTDYGLDFGALCSNLVSPCSFSKVTFFQHM